MKHVINLELIRSLIYMLPLICASCASISPSYFCRTITNTNTLHIIIATSDFEIDCRFWLYSSTACLSRSFGMGAPFAWHSSFSLIRFHLSVFGRAYARARMHSQCAAGAFIMIFFVFFALGWYRLVSACYYFDAFSIRCRG